MPALRRAPTSRGVERPCPDVVLIDLESPSCDLLEQMFQVSRSVRRPIAMFVDRMREEMERAKQALAERKLFERAKGILMRERELTEEDAYALLRRAAMSESRRIVDVVQSLVTAAGCSPVRATERG